MSVELPARAGVVFLRFRNRRIGIGIRSVGRELPKEQDIFRRSDTHLGAVFCVFRPPQPIGLVVLPDHIGNYRDSPAANQALAFQMIGTFIRESVDRIHPESGDAAIPDTVFGVDAIHPARF